MTDWHDLVVAATVGTASRPVDLAATPEPVLSAAPPTDDPAGSLLDAAVAFAVAHRAGRRPPRREIPAPAPDDGRPVVSALAGELLRMVLVDRELDLAELVLDEIAASGRRLPDPLVPTALALASRHAALRDRTLRASGPVAPWLAQQNPAWAWVLAGGTAPAAAFDPATWETGDRRERLAQLRALRRTDPEAASTLLRSAWPSTAPDERADLLTALGAVGPADELLLEATLDDRRVAVRQLSAELLARIEGSAFRQRAANRARGLVSVERRGLRRALAVTDPAPFDPAARRDGLQEAPGAPRALGAAAVAGSGPVAARVRQLVAAAPLAVWPDTTGLTPDQLTTMAADRFADELVTGWADAAVRERDPRWVAALLKIAKDRAVLQRRRAELVGVLPRTERGRAVVAALAGAAPGDVAGILASAPAPWDTAVTEAFASWWRRAARTPPGRELLAVLPLAGRGLPATREHTAALRDTLDRAPTGAIWLRAAREAAETLDLRRRLHEELR